MLIEITRYNRKTLSHPNAVQRWVLWLQDNHAAAAINGAAGARHLSRQRWWARPARSRPGTLGRGAWGSRFFQHWVLTSLYMALQCNSPSSMLRARGIVKKLFSR